MSDNTSAAFPTTLTVTATVALASFAGFLYYLSQIDPEMTARTSSGVIESIDSDSGNKTAPVFDFYTRLPEAEWVPMSPDADAAEMIPSANKPSLDNPFVLQVGSFRSAGEADQRRASLLLLGMNVHVRQIDLQPSDTWHRVLVGPFTSHAELERALDLLADSGIESLVLSASNSL